MSSWVSPLWALTLVAVSAGGARLSRLDLYHNRIGDTGAAALCAFAARGEGGDSGQQSGGIRELILGFNGLTPAAATAIGAAIGGGGAQAASEPEPEPEPEPGSGRARSWSLKTLDLSWNPLGASGLKSLCRALSGVDGRARTPTLRRVRMTEATEDILDLPALQRVLDDDTRAGGGTTPLAAVADGSPASRGFRVVRSRRVGKEEGGSSGGGPELHLVRRRRGSVGKVEQGAVGGGNAGKPLQIGKTRDSFLLRKPADG